MDPITKEDIETLEQYLEYVEERNLWRAGDLYFKVQDLVRKLQVQVNSPTSRSSK